MTDSTQASERQHHLGATLYLTLSENNRFLVVGTTQDNDGLTAKIFEAFIRP